MVVGRMTFLGACTFNILCIVVYKRYDVASGILGVGATFTAAKEFQHKEVLRNETGESGTLHQKANVTQSVMIEHAIYQVGWPSLLCFSLSRTPSLNGVSNILAHTGTTTGRTVRQESISNCGSAAGYDTSSSSSMHQTHYQTI